MTQEEVDESKVHKVEVKDIIGEYRQIQEEKERERKLHISSAQSRYLDE